MTMTKVTRDVYGRLMLYAIIALLPVATYGFLGSIIFADAKFDDNITGLHTTENLKLYGSMIRFTALYAVLVMFSSWATIYYMKIIWSKEENQGPNGKLIFYIRFASIISVLICIPLLISEGLIGNPFRDKSMQTLLGGPLGSKNLTRLNWMFDTIDGITCLVLLLTAIIVGTLVASHVPEKKREGADIKSLNELVTWGTAVEKMQMIRQVLIISTIVAILILLTIQARFDISLSLFKPPFPNVESSRDSFEAGAAAVGFAWATVLTSTLAAIYLPAAFRLTPDYEAAIASGKVESSLIERYAGHTLRALAIISPALIKSLIELFK
jgi:hypothetical protein